MADVVDPNHDDRGLMNFMQRFLGFIPIVNLDQQSMAVCFDKERNGKGCIVETLMSVLDEAEMPLVKSN